MDQQTHQLISTISDTSTEYLGEDPLSPAPASDLPYAIDIHSITYKQMTQLFDTIRSHYWCPFMSQAQFFYPPLNAAEVTRLTGIGCAFTKYDRATALDERGEWPFLAIAGHLEAWAAEVLVAMGYGQRVYSGYSEVSAIAEGDIMFLSGLHCRAPGKFDLNEKAPWDL
jgi:hypothetical protein